MKKKNKPIIIIINIINIIIISCCIFTMRHNIIRKINSWTEKPITELNLSDEQKLADFNYLYDSIVTSMPSNNAIYGTAPDIYVREGVPDKEEFASDDPYTYENRLKWDNVLIKAIETINEEENAE